MERERQRRMLERLRDGASTSSCVGFVYASSPLNRCFIFKELVFDRLGR